MTKSSLIAPFIMFAIFLITAIMLCVENLVLYNPLNPTKLSDDKIRMLLPDQTFDHHLNSTEFANFSKILNERHEPYR